MNNTCPVALLSFPQASLWSEQITVMKQDKSHAKKQSPTSTPSVKESEQHRVKSIHKKDTSVNGKKNKSSCQAQNILTRNCWIMPCFSPHTAQKTTTKTLIKTEKIYQKSSVQTESILQKKILRETGVQTEWVSFNSSLTFKPRFYCKSISDLLSLWWETVLCAGPDSSPLKNQ